MGNSCTGPATFYPAKARRAPWRSVRRAQPRAFSRFSITRWIPVRDGYPLGRIEDQVRAGPLLAAAMGDDTASIFPDGGSSHSVAGGPAVAGGLGGKHQIRRGGLQQLAASPMGRILLLVPARPQFTTLPGAGERVSARAVRED